VATEICNLSLSLSLSVLLSAVLLKIFLLPFFFVCGVEYLSYALLEAKKPAVGSS
jgi:hypothetical protein